MFRYATATPTERVSDWDRELDYDPADVPSNEASFPVHPAQAETAPILSQRCEDSDD